MDTPGTQRRSLLLASLASSLGLTSCASSRPMSFRATSRYGDRPAVMAIGDSLYQGVRSLSFTAELARHSPPMQLAGCLNLPMTAPDPRRPILFDLEASLRRGVVAHFVATIRETCLTNASQWLTAGPWSGHEAFDNIAVGGAEVASL